MARASIALLSAVLLSATAPTLGTLPQFLRTMYGSVEAEAERLAEAVGALQETTDRLVATAGDRDSILRLDRDAERTVRTARAFDLKAARLAELADQLMQAARSEPVP
jgi:hypothetical protein